MNTLAGQVSSVRKQRLSLAFLIGVLFLLGAWGALYWSESLFTESHLVGYYCCVTEQDLPAKGTLERTFSDFFRTSPGKHLPSILFVTINASFFARGVLRGHRKAWLPFLFALLGVSYLALDFGLIALSQSISDSVVGPVTSAYKGYHRTWYGIALHLVLWATLFYALARASRPIAKGAR